MLKLRRSLRAANYCQFSLHVLFLVPDRQACLLGDPEGSGGGGFHAPRGPLQLDEGHQGCVYQALGYFSQAHLRVHPCNKHSMKRGVLSGFRAGASTKYRPLYPLDHKRDRAVMFAGLAAWLKFSHEVLSRCRLVCLRGARLFGSSSLRLSPGQDASSPGRPCSSEEKA